MKIFMEYLQALGQLLSAAELCALHVRTRWEMQTSQPNGLWEEDRRRKSKYKNNHMKIYMEYLQTLDHLPFPAELCAPHVRARRLTQNPKPKNTKISMPIESRNLEIIT